MKISSRRRVDTPPPFALRRLNSWLRDEAAATGLPIGALMVFAVVVNVWVTRIAPNPVHPDEHFQILEFAWARAGLASPATLPWEWAARIRSTLQPAAALGLLRGLHAVGVTSPFTWVLVLRLASLTLALLVMFAVLAHEAPTHARRERRVLWGVGLLLWITPVFLARFTSENFGGMALALAIVLVERRPGDRAPTGIEPRLVLAGTLLGLSFVFRFQMILAIVPVLVGVALHREAVEKARGVRSAVVMALTAGAVVIAASLVDRWFYGAVVFTPWNYLRVNLLEGRAAAFGTSAWYTYPVDAALWLGPPLGLLIVLLACIGLVARPRSLWTWSVASFVIGQSCIGHKESRFLLPLLYALPLLVARGAALLPACRAWRAGAWLLVTQNAALLLLLATPAVHHGKEFDAHYFRWLWDTAERTSPDTVFVLADEGSPYRAWNLETSVYRHPRVRGVIHHSGEPIPPSVPVDTPPERLVMLTQGGAQPLVEGANVGTVVYRAEPGYRKMARAVGMESAPWVKWAESLDGWSSSSAVRTVHAVQQPGPSAPITRVP